MTTVAVLAFLVAGSIATLAFIKYRLFVTSDVVIAGEPVPFFVQEGEGAYALVERLISDGVLPESEFWRPFVRLEARTGCLQAGEHLLPAEATPSRVFDVACETAYAPGIRLVFIEGLNMYQLADRMSGAGLGERDEILRLAQDREFLNTLAIEAPTLEGYLAPNTYEFEEDSGPAEVFTQLAQAGSVVREELFAAPSAIKEQYTEHEILTVASIVEREARVDDERPIVARVIYNRLDRGMKVQCDPTCVYGPDTYNQRPSPATCRSDRSTHSTYMLPALPPTPIAMPRRSSIDAALHPAEDPNVLYFAARMDGSRRHVFANTYEEHIANVDRYIRGR
ncbi:MAG: UPF0755 protein [Bradymonadia bacterium]|jgi:UPF0755 protein